MYKFPLEDHSGQTILAGMAVNITERKAVERLKNEFISVVSHELRTPVTSIRGAIGLMTGGVAGAVPAEMKQLLQIAERNTQRLSDLLNDILDLQKMEAGSMMMESNPLDLARVVALAIDLNAPYASELDVTIHLEPTSKTAPVLGDAARLQQVMANLLSNAAKYSPPGGQVTVRLERFYDMEAGWHRVSIHNSGEEIPEAFRTRVFSKFAQADASSTRSRGGTGLGLSISKSIVEQHRGRIGFESDATSGTTFYFELPEIESKV